MDAGNSVFSEGCGEIEDRGINGKWLRPVPVAIETAELGAVTRARML